MLSSILPAVLVLLAVASAAAQPTTIRVATYNLLKYPNSDSTQRNASLRTVLGAMRPDVIVDQEIETARSVSLFRDSVLDRVFDGRFASAPFLDVSRDTEEAFFYDSTKVSYLEMEVIRPTAPDTNGRGIFGYRFAVHGTSDTVWIYTVHLKASDGTADIQQRAREAALLRRHLDSVRSGQHVIVAGDFNVYNSSEPALQVLMGEGANARLLDPLTSRGNWHANPDFAAIHTQCPRDRKFGGGVDGGMDDRFDLILISPSLSSIIDRGTYTAFGNDGRHFNDSINRPPNLAVSAEVAQALHDGSDHLPVFADFHFGVSSAPAQPALAHLRVTPNPARDVVRFDLGRATGAGALVIRSVDGIELARIAITAGDSEATWRSHAAPSGVYTYTLETATHHAGGTLIIVR